MISFLEDDKKKIDEAVSLSIVSSKEAQNKIIEYMRYSALGGKRLRGILTLETAKMFGLSSDDIFPFAVAMECVHAYSLIHDDLPCMDDDDIRRGKPSCHVAFGEANAVLAGDALLTHAFTVLSECEWGKKYPDRTLKAIRILSDKAGYRGMVGGQVLDLEAVEKAVSADELSDMQKLKTGALMKAAVLIGAAAAGAEEELCRFAEGYADEFGSAFQIVDDLADFNGDYDVLDGNSYVKIHGAEKAKMDAYLCISRAGSYLYELDKRGYDTGALATLLDYLISAMEK